MKLKRIILCSVAMVWVIVFGISGAKADLINNGGFETGRNPPQTSFQVLPDPNSAIEGWVITNGTIDWISSAYWAPHSGSRSVDLSGNGAGTISTSFDTIKDQTYTVTFWLSGNFVDTGSGNGRSVLVSADGVSQEFLFPTPSTWAKDNMGWVQKAFTFVADGTSAVLTFESLEGNAYGPVIDDVCVTDRLSTVLLPSTAWLLGPGLLGLVGWWRFRKG